MPTDRTPETLHDREIELVARVWPEGMPTRDRVVLDALPAGDRSRILKRLEAVWRADCGEPLGPLADLAGLKRAAFFNLRRSWRAKSLAGLVPNETKAGRRVAAPADDPLRARAASHLREDPGRRNVDIAKAMMEDGKLIESAAGSHAALTVLQRLERIVQHQRRELVNDPDFLRKAFGCGLVLDLTAVSVVLDERERTQAVVSLLVETASGVVLGSALGRFDEGANLQQEAMVSALGFLHELKVDLPSCSARWPDLGLMLPAVADVDRIEAVLKPHVNNLVVGSVGGFSFGQQIVQIVGPRVGRMVLNPRRTLKVDPAGFVEKRQAAVVSLKEAKSIWAREVQRHNAGRIEALVEAGMINESGSRNGKLATAIGAIINALKAD